MITFKRLLIEGIRHPGGFVRFITHLPEFIKLFVRLFKDSRVPLMPKVLLTAALAYLISPVDLLPDFIIPIVGYLDDLFLLILSLRYLLKKCPPQVLDEHAAALDNK